MNPLPGGQPHLLYVEEVDVDARDDTAFVGHVECPFPSASIRKFHELSKPTRFVEVPSFKDDPNSDAGTEFTMLRERVEHRWTIGGYCCRQVGVTYAAKFPLRWLNPLTGKREVCATVEVGSVPVSCCGYDEVISNVGLIEALCDWRDWNRYERDEGPWPADLPSVPGVYPVYYWCDGYGEGFNDGLTLSIEDAWSGEAFRRAWHTNPTFP